MLKGPKEQMLRAENTANDFWGKSIKYIVVISALIAIIFPVFNIYFVVPPFEKILISNLESESLRTARHLSMMMNLKDRIIKKEILGPDDLEEVNRHMKEFNLMKLKIFSETGEVIFSTDASDVGKINDKVYFRETVMKGGTYAHFVERESKSLDNEQQSRHVVETYVPIMENGLFIGSMEIYYDINSHYNVMKEMIYKTTVMPLGFMVILLVIALISMYRGIGAGTDATPNSIKSRHKSPIYFMLITGISIFVAESIAMVIIVALPEASFASQTFLDALLVVLLVAPILYFYSYRPLYLRNVKLKEASDFLARAKNEWEDTFNTINDSITIHDMDFNIIRSNRASEELLGLPSADILAQKCYMSYHGTECPSAGCPSCLTLKNEQPSVNEIFEPHLNKYIEIKALPRFNRNNQLIGMLHIVSDISERKQAEKILKEAKEVAESANIAKSEFLANMSHEIRTPMNAIIGMTDLVLDTRLETEQKEYVEAVRQSADSLLGLLNSILDFSKIEAGKLMLETRSFHLKEMIESVRNILTAQAEQKSLSLICEIAPDIPEYVSGDELHLRQVIVNLISNAIKFTHEGKIALIVNRVEDPEVFAANNGDSTTAIHFCVSDTGIGIPADKIESIFDIFTQGDGSITREYGGTGLGLTISKEIVGKMDGEMWVTSEHGKGSDFHFIVKFNVDDESKMGPADSKGSHICKGTSLTGLHILVAEDNVLNQRVAVRMLEKLGHTAVVVNNGKEIFGLLKKEHYDLVLMDIQMPEMDGIVATRMIRKSINVSFNSNIPIIALTAHAFEDDRQQCLNAGMNGYITKPFTRKQLIHAIELCMSDITGHDTFNRHNSLDISGVIDKQMALEHCDDDEELLDEIWNIFVNDAPSKMSTLETVIDAGNSKLVERQAHTLKSNAANIGADLMRECASKVEAAGRKQDIFEAKEEFNALEIEFGRALKELKKILYQHNPV
jgi:PAS domain S-box-containing protein